MADCRQGLPEGEIRNYETLRYLLEKKEKMSAIIPPCTPSQKNPMIAPAACADSTRSLVGRALLRCCSLREMQ